jgi:hypothetical protein
MASKRVAFWFVSVAAVAAAALLLTRRQERHSQTAAQGIRYDAGL